MCQISNKTKKLRAAMTVYKFAPDGDRSQYATGLRSFINGYRGRGKRLTYPKGERVESPSGPGIMAYVVKPRCFVRDYIEMKIPRGAMVRFGKDVERKMVAASVVIVGARLGKPRR